MGALLVTVAGPRQRRELSLLDDWPIRDLLPLVVDQVGETDDGTGSWVLRSGDRSLPEEQSLTACGVSAGATLVLDRLPAGTVPSSHLPVAPSQPPHAPAPTLVTLPTPVTPTPPVEAQASTAPAPASTTPTQASTTPTQASTTPTQNPPPPAQAPSTPAQAPPAPAQGPASSPAPAPPAAAVVAPPLPAPPAPTRPMKPREPEPAAAPPAPRRSQPTRPARRRAPVAIGAVTVLLLLGAGAWRTFLRPPRPAPPPPKASPTAPPTRGLPPIVDLSAVVHGTIVGTDSVQVGYFSRTPEGAAEAAHNYLWALAGSDDPSGLLKQIAAPGRARSLAAAAQQSKDPLLEQFYLGFRTVQPTVQSYDASDPTITVPVTGVPFEVRLRWTNDPTGGDWKLSSIQRLDTGTPSPQPAPS